MTRIEFTTRIKIIASICIVATIGLMVGLNSIIIVPQRKELKRIKKELVEVETKLGESRGEQKKLSKEKGLFESDAIKGIPQKIQISEYFKNMERLLSEKKASISEAALVEEKYFQVKEDPTKILCQGNFKMTFGSIKKEELFEYLKSIDTDSRFIQFVGLSYESPSKYTPPNPEEILDKSVYTISLDYNVYFIINNEDNIQGEAV